MNADPFIKKLIGSRQVGSKVPVIKQIKRVKVLDAGSLILPDDNEQDLKIKQHCNYLKLMRQQITKDRIRVEKLISPGRPPQHFVPV